MSWFESDTFTFVILPILIFLSRICDVSLGTIRIIAVSRGHRFRAAILGFFEVLIWITVISRVMQNLNNIWCYIAYAGGFATGNYVGLLIEQKLAMGQLIVRIIFRKEANELLAEMNRRGFGVTCIEGEGAKGPVHLLYSVVQRNDLEELLSLIQEYNPKAFYSIEDVRHVREGIFRTSKHPFGHFLRRRKAK
ncbi:MAG: DUF2179 domain-containing protein [Sedimentisphaerales bacterium]|nr:DUF2179 domain-containing protein [Sedimentisphaerales bacterium]